MRRFFARNRARTIAVVDLASGHVGCAIVACSQGRSTVLAHARSALSLELRDVEHARARFAEEIADACGRAYALYRSKKSASHIAEVHAVVHAPWVSSRTVSAKASSENEIIIRPQHIAKLLDAAVGNSGVDRERLFEARTVSIALNGYLTDAPEGKRAHTVELQAIASIIDDAAHKTIVEALHRAFPAAQLSLTSASRVFASTLPHLQLPRDCVITDFGIQALQLTLMREHTVVGERAAFEGLAYALQLVHGTKPPEELLSLFRMLARDACADDACAALERALADAEPALVKTYAGHFAALAETKRLPSTLILLAHPDAAPWLEHFFERIDFTQFTMTSMPFAVHILGLDDFSDRIAGDRSVDPMLALIALYATAVA